MSSTPSIPPEVGTALTRHTPVALAPTAWDPFQLMDRLDDEAFRRELEGIASTELVYVVKEGGQEHVGLSKAGVDECCLALVSQGQVIREEEIDHLILGEGEDREALFKVKAARYAVNGDGKEVRLDQVIGVKRQPLYYDARALDLDSKVPSKKYKGQTYRELLGFEDGRGYLAWMAENFNEPEIRTFVAAILNGEALEMRPGKKLNPHWYETGAMKAARNARLRLIPGNVRAAVIANARQMGAVKEVELAGAAPSRAAARPTTQPSAQPAPRPAAPTPTVVDHETAGSLLADDRMPIGTHNKGKPFSECSTEDLTSARDWCVQQGVKRLKGGVTTQDVADRISSVLREREKDQGALPLDGPRDGETPEDPAALAMGDGGPHSFDDLPF